MFDVRTRELKGADYIEISSIWLRGDLGPITIWSCPGGYQNHHECESMWTRHYQRTHTSSPHVCPYPPSPHTWVPQCHQSRRH